MNSQAFDTDKVKDLCRRFRWLLESREAKTEEACCALTLVLKGIINADEMPPEAANFLVLKIISDLVGPKIEEDESPIRVPAAIPVIKGNGQG